MVRSATRGERYLSTANTVHKPEQEHGASRVVSAEGEVPVDLAGMRLDQVAASLFPEYSRARLQTWIREGSLRVDGEQRRPRDPVQVGDHLTIHAQLAPEVAWTPESLPLNVIYEDDEVLVINKPPGLVVHPGAGNPSGTLVNALLSYRPSLEQIPRGGIVHRIDKDTSGLLVVAATLQSHSALVDQLQVKSVQREYLAIVRGAPTGGSTIDAPIGRHPRQRKRMAVVPHGGKSAITHYLIKQRFAHYTALEVHLETGRTHQIRVHMAHRGYPLVGDPVYGGRLQLPRGCSDELAAMLRRFRRQALHARRLSFVHPGSAAPMSFEAEVPDDLRQLLQVLGEQDGPQAAEGNP